MAIKDLIGPGFIGSDTIEFRINHSPAQTTSTGGGDTTDDADDDYGGS